MDDDMKARAQALRDLQYLYLSRLDNLIDLERAYKEGKCRTPLYKYHKMRIENLFKANRDALQGKTFPSQDEIVPGDATGEG